MIHALAATAADHVYLYWKVGYELHAISLLICNQFFEATVPPKLREPWHRETMQRVFGLLLAKQDDGSLLHKFCDWASEYKDFDFAPLLDSLGFRDATAFFTAYASPVFH